MFTGIISHIGKVISIRKVGLSFRLTIKEPDLSRKINTGDSVSVNGVCLTVIDKTRDSFDVEAVEETVSKTTFKYIKQGDNLNLELPVAVGARFDGHIVQGHVDCVGKIKSIKKLKNSWIFKIQIPEEYKIYIVKVGSIAVDGISLTIADVDKNFINISIIPYTMMHTILKYKKTGDLVNIEFDIIGKYVTNYLNNITLNKNKGANITIENLSRIGF